MRAGSTDQVRQALVQVLDGLILSLQDKLGKNVNYTMTALNQVVEEVKNNY